ncbi:MAG: TonB-dependent receptor [Magnetococcales bacterium]|nr:TonB-dependent receptor [Magnetococcales bacterium]
MNNKIKILICSVFFSLPITLEKTLANDSTPFAKYQLNSSDNEDRLEEAKLLDLLDGLTKLATKTKLNINYTPGMTSILTAQTLTELGVQSVWEALSLVPGMELAIDRLGNKLIIARSQGGRFASGNLKLMLNNMPMNVAFSGLAPGIMNMPISQIERIEVINGPGAAVHGEFAFSGIVNIISKKNANEIHVGAGQYGSTSIGGITSWRVDKKEFSVSGELKKRDSNDLDSGPDSLDSFNLGSYSNAPGTINNREEFSSFIATANGEIWDLSVVGLWDQFGEHFGLGAFLPPDSSSNKTKNQNLAIQGGILKPIAESWELSLRASWMDYQLHQDDLNYYPAITGAYPDGVIQDNNYEETRFQNNVDLVWRGVKKHSFLLGGEFVQVQTENVWRSLNVDLTTGAALNEQQRYTGTQNWVDENHSRKIHSIIIQDEYRPNDSWLMTIGARHDDISDVGDAFSPRLAIVHKHSKNHIFKAQYAKAFRPPTFYEMWRGVDIKPETLTTTEAGYIYNTDRFLSRIRIFHNRYHSPIMYNFGSYSNGEDSKSIGSEWDWQWDINETLKLTGAVSYSHAEDESTDEPPGGGAAWLGHGGLVYKHHSGFRVGGLIKYVGPRHRAVADTRDKLKSYMVFDLNGEIPIRSIDGAVVQWGAKNIFAADVRFPAEIITDPNGNSIPSFSDDYPMQPQYFWLKLSWKF